MCLNGDHNGLLQNKYINLKRIADRAYANAIETGTQTDWDHFEDLEMEVADYAHQHEDEIDWDNLDA